MQAVGADPGPQDLEGLESVTRRAAKYDANEDAAIPRAATGGLMPWRDRQVGDREAELEDHAHRVRDHAAQKIRQHDAAPEADQRADCAEHEGLEHEEPKKTRGLGAEEAKPDYNERPGDGRGRRRVVNDEHAGDEADRAQPGQHGLKGAPGCARSRGRAARGGRR